MMLEALLHKENCFVTLTYDESKRSTTGEINSNAPLQLNPKHLSDWLKRFRARISPLHVRFFAVGEYGDAQGRPHYHVVLFGWSVCKRGRTKRALGSTRSDWANCCSSCRLIGETWGHGDIEIGEFNPKTAAYTAEYTVKKMTRKDDPRLKGRFPEFARMSLKPGIGADAMHQVASDLMLHRLDERSDVPTSLRHGAREWPLGRYLTRKLRRLSGKEENAPEETLQKIKEELRPLREAAFASSSPLSEAIAAQSEQPIRNLEARQKIHKRRVL